jgi:DNA-binding MarR family transcriptional regulator
MKLEVLDKLAANLKGSEFRVFLKLLRQLDYQNLKQIQQTQIADELEMQKQNVNRAINRLLKVGILLKGPRIGKSCSYRLNPHFTRNLLN